MLMSAVARGENDDLQRGLALMNDMEDKKALEAFGLALEKAGTDAEKAVIHVHMGVAYFNLLDTESARKSFAQALELDPQVSLPQTVSPKIRELFQEVEEQHKKKTAPVKPPPRAAGSKGSSGAKAGAGSTGRNQAAAGHSGGDGRTGLRTGAYVTLGLAVAAAGAGVALGVMASGAEKDANEVDAQDRPVRPYSEAADLHDKARTYALSANILFGAAGASAVASAVLFYLGYRSGGSQDRAGISLVPLRDGAVVRLGGITW